MKYSILYLAFLVGVTLAVPHHTPDHHESEESEEVTDHHLHHHEEEETNSPDDYHHHGDNELKKGDYHTCLGCHHHSDKWAKHKSDWKEFRTQMSEMAEDMEEVKNDVKELKKDMVKASSEEVYTVLGLGFDNEIEMDNVKLTHKSKMLVKKVSSDGTVSNDSVPSNCAIITMEKHNPENLNYWYRIKGSDTGIYWHNGASLRFHIVTADGTHKYIMLGDTLKNEEAVYSIFVPGNAFFAVEPMDDKDPDVYTIISYAVIPAWSPENYIKIPREEKEDGTGLSYIPTQAVLDNLEEDV